MIGEKIQQYTILEKLGEGDFGVVYKAEDDIHDRYVAFRQLPETLCANPAEKENLRSYIQKISSIDHENISRVYEAIEAEGEYIFVASECFDEGDSLKERLAEGSIPVQDAIDITGQIAAGISELHDEGVIHAELRPSNIFITDEGIAKAADLRFVHRISGATTLEKFAYLSPEQVRQKDLSHHTDIWSLAVIFYEIVTGVTPFKGEYQQALSYSILNAEPQPIPEAYDESFPGMKSFFQKALGKLPTERFASMADFSAALQKIEEAGSMSELSLPDDAS